MLDVIQDQLAPLPEIASTVFVWRVVQLPVLYAVFESTGTTISVNDAGNALVFESAGTDVLLLFIQTLV